MHEPAQLSAALADRYRIERELGQGGMATVYLAHDVRHGRKVALKILRPELAAVIGAERFLTEIKTTASLQHPHILPLHDSGEAAGAVFYVMPYVEGESLRHRLNRDKQLPVEDAVRITREVAGALDYAHRHGVIHRDIKPENILLHDGTALVADFGIALAVSSAGGSTRMTETGMSLGTPHYMSPEQAMGERELSARSDVYALGCVLYEMLVGEPPFTGPTPQAIVAKVITEKPPLATALRDSVPRHVARAIQKSLAKLPADRFASAAELAAALTRPGMIDEEAGEAAPGTPRPTANRLSTAGLGALALLAIAAALWGWLRPGPAPVVTASYVKFAPREAPLPGPVDGALSKDGSMLVYVGPGEGGRGSGRLWLKRRGELHPSAIAGTDGATAPFFSPDSRWIAFFADGRLKKIPASGGGVVTLADAPTTFHWGGWLEGGRIVFAGPAFSLVMVGEEGGEAAEPVVSPADIGPGRGAVGAIPLPGGRAFLFAACGTNCSPTDIWAMDLETGKATLLLKDAFPVSVLPTGELLYTPGSGVMLAAPFDLGALKLTGPGRPVVEGLARFGMFAVADDGTLVYQESGGMGGASIPVWVTRDGRETPIDSSWSGDVNSVALSPDGTRLAVTAINGQTEDVWVKELDHGPLAKITFGEQPYGRVRWSADGGSLFYLGGAEVLAKRADGTGAARVRTPGGRKIWSEVEESRDGKWLLLRSLEGGERNIYALAAGDTVIRSLLTSDADEFGPTLSPDGKWLAFAGQEGALTQVFVTPFPEVSSAKWQVSTDGGSEPVWSRDGRELFYVRNNTDLMVAQVSTAGTFSVVSRKTLFPVGPYARDAAHRIYDVTKDGQRFVMIRTSSFATGDLVLIENWLELLKAKLQR